ncbi:MAG: diacylglycerol kinase family protein [Balneolaceae bacterium]
MKHYAFIYNPAARGRKIESKIKVLSKYIDEQLPESELFYSDSREHISELVQQVKNDFEVIVACGGDGTVREVAAQLVGTELTMGIIPLGTGNDLCKSLAIPNDFEKALQLLLEDSRVKIDVGYCNDFIFLNTLGFGFDGLTNSYAHRIENLPSILRYGAAALKANFHHEPFSVRIETKSGSTCKRLIMATVANGRVEGGAFWIAPEASVTDGKLNLVTIKPLSKWLVPLLLPLFLIKKANWVSYVSSYEVEALSFYFENEVVIHADGEIIKNNVSKYFIRLAPNDLEVICGL